MMIRWYISKNDEALIVKMRVDTAEKEFLKGSKKSFHLDGPDCDNLNYCVGIRVGLMAGGLSCMASAPESNDYGS